METIWDVILDILDKADADEAAKIAIQAVKDFFGRLK